MNRALSDNYHSKSQIARVITESWMAQNMFCPNCGAESLEQFTNNSELQIKHPQNNFIKNKIRQQLQLLRDKNYLSFSGSGRYIVTKQTFVYDKV